MESQPELDSHVRRTPACDSIERPDDYYLTLQQFEATKKVGKSGPVEKRWNELYKYLFPNATYVPPCCKYPRS